MKHRIILDCSELRQLYCDEGLPMRILAERYGCSSATIANRLRACGVVARSGRYEARYIAEEALRQLYLIDRLPMAVIAAHFGVSIATLYNRRRAYGMPTRKEQDGLV